MRILVLGDSCSAGIGSSQAVYPGTLHTLLGSAHRIENHAVPGFTSADAARYYRRVLARQRWDFVIIYLGNTDGSRSVYKGVYRRWRDTSGWSARRRRPRPVVRIKAREQVIFDDRDERLSVATTPQDLRKNLESIVRRAGRHGTRFILINPIANERFPAALMGRNAPFYKIVGLNACLADRLIGLGALSQELVKAIGDHERGDLVAAVDRYRQLAANQSPVQAIALNNLAVVLDQQNVDDEPVAILKQLTTAVGASGAVAAYNLSRILVHRDQHEEARKYAILAVERDSDLYRVKSAYRQQIASLSSHANVDVVDLAGLLTHVDFVDYCHPTAEAHRTVAAAIAPHLTRVHGVDAREDDARYVCVHPSPTAYFDFRSTMVDHFAIDFDVAQYDIQREATVLLDRAGELGSCDLVHAAPTWPAPESDLQANILNTFSYAAGHPVITSLDDIRKLLPEHGWEIGRFPEFYLDRILHDYAAMAESWRIDGLPGSADAYWRLSSSVYQERVLPRLPAGGVRTLRTDKVYCRRILDKVCLQLTGSATLFGDIRATRIATVKYWYLREAFRYGAHSRCSMLYPAWDLEKLVEGVYVSLIIARRQGDSVAEALAVSLLEKMVRLREVHEKHAIHPVEFGFSAGHEQYSSELAELRRLFTEDVGRTGDQRTTP